MPTAQLWAYRVVDEVLELDNGNVVFVVVGVVVTLDDELVHGHLSPGWGEKTKRKDFNPFLPTGQFMAPN